MTLNIQSTGIPLNAWLAQLTLCFAPYATHIFTGIPTFVYLHKPGPSWHHVVNFFNPTTILWRYLIITVRRLRCTSWTSYKFAASNAAFWTGREWRGDEQIMIKSEEWNLHKPDKTRARFLSISVFGTLLVIAQGIQALYEIVLQIKTGFTFIQSVAGVFIPLAIISLVRLPPAPWLTNELAYREVSLFELEDIQLGVWRRSYNPLFDHQRNSNLLNGHGPGTTNKAGMLPPRYLPSVLLCVAFLLLLVGFVAIGISHPIMDDGFSRHFNLSIILQHFLYQTLVVATLLISSFYLLRGRGDTTIIPCISSWWYTAYTIFWYLYVVVTIIVNALEMRRTSCGLYTTWPVSAGLDDRLCAASGI